MSADKFQSKYRIPSARHPNWDYSSNGIYFITICTKNRQYFLGECNKGEMKLSTAGAIAQGFWYEIPKHFPFITLSEFIVMPNHINGILIFDKNLVEKNIDKISNIDVETGHCPVSTTDDALGKDKTEPHYRFRNQGKHTISSIVGSYKSVCTKHIRKITPDFEWQTRFWDHIIRDDNAFDTIRQYIINNPITWEDDKLFGEQTDNSIEQSSNPDR
jgi:REP element-mobilizing transposase RayT